MNKIVVDEGQFDWLLASRMRASVDRSTDSVPVYNFVELDASGNPTSKQATIYYRGDRMLFDGDDMETEKFMAFVGLLDMVDEGETEIEAIEEDEDAGY